MHPQGRTEWWWDLLALLVLALSSALFLKLVPGSLPPYGGDVVVHVYPLLSLLAHGLHAGRPVLWNAYAAGGYPLAPYSALALYPPVAISLLLWPVATAIGALYLLYVFVLGAGMYWLGSDLGLSRPARLLAAVTMAWGGFVAAHIYAGHLFELGAICPLPIAFLLLRRAIVHERVIDALWCGGVLGLMVLAAGIQFLPFALLPLPALALWHTALRLRTGGRAALPLGLLALAGVVGLVVSAVYLLPFDEILGYTLRAASVPYGVAAAQSLPWGGLTMLVAPDALGNAAANTYWPADRRQPYFHEIYAYAGLLPLLLAPMATSRCRAARPYAVLALAALLVMLGGNTPLYRLFYDLHLPGGDLFRVPARAGYVLDFALAVLAGYGLDAFLVPIARAKAGSVDVHLPERGRPRPPGMGIAVEDVHAATPTLLSSLSRLSLPGAMAPGIAVALCVVVGLLAVAAGALAVPSAARALALSAALRLAPVLALALGASLLARRDPRLALLLPALAMCDLYTANAVLFRPTDPAAYFTGIAAERVLPSPDSGFRFWARDNAIPPGLSMVTQSSLDVQDPAPLAEADYWRLSHPGEVERAGGNNVVTGRDRILDYVPFFLRLFAVRTILSDTPVPDAALHPTGRIVSRRWIAPGGAYWNVAWLTATSYVYDNLLALPPSFVVPHSVQAPDATDALSATQRVDLRQVVVLSGAPEARSGILSPIWQWWAGWLGGAPENRRDVAADGGRTGGYLVMDDGWFPDWRSTVDGRETPVWRADYLLRAIRIPPGRHQVAMIYAPFSYLLGATITIIASFSLLVLALACIVLHVRARHPMRKGVPATVVSDT
jgi:hypothetical protein